MIQSIFKFWQDWSDLITQLVLREIKARYKQSILGYVWVILVPLLRLIVLTLVFSTIMRVNTGAIPYSVFLFTALVPWSFFANSITAATNSLIANISLITKIKMPLLVFPLASVIVKMVDLCLSFLILFILILAFGLPLRLSWAWVPLIFLVQTCFTLGVSFVLAAINVYYRDIENMLEVLLTLWLYLTPVVYPPELIPAKWQPFFNLNPMMGIINAYRNALLHGVPPAWPSFLWATFISLAVLLIGIKFFQKKSQNFADVI
jgi:lipopolysaccharide transport system permease protein